MIHIIVAQNSQQQKEQQRLRIQDINSVGSHTCMYFVNSYMLNHSFLLLLLLCTLSAELNEYVGR